MGSHELYGIEKINQQQLREIQPSGTEICEAFPPGPHTKVTFEYTGLLPAH